MARKESWFNQGPAAPPVRYHPGPQAAELAELSRNKGAGGSALRKRMRWKRNGIEAGLKNLRRLALTSKPPICILMYPTFRRLLRRRAAVCARASPAEAPAVEEWMVGN